MGCHLMDWIRRAGRRSCSGLCASGVVLAGVAFTGWRVARIATAFVRRVRLSGGTSVRWRPIVFHVARLVLGTVVFVPLPIGGLNSSLPQALVGLLYPGSLFRDAGGAFATDR
jgi:hypothetical protein